MKHRPLGRTGISVSPLCLGAMMFGQWGNPDHDDCVAIIHAALDVGINFVDTADVYSRGESGGTSSAARQVCSTTTSTPPATGRPARSSSAPTASSAGNWRSSRRVGRWADRCSGEHHRSALAAKLR